MAPWNRTETPVHEDIAQLDLRQYSLLVAFDTRLCGNRRNMALVNEAESEALVALVRCTNVIDAYDPASTSEHMSYDFDRTCWSNWY